jgi:hypothetical protein
VGDSTAYSCISCGDFSISGRAVAILKNDTGERWKASAWIRQNQIEKITVSTIVEWQKNVVPSLETRAIRALRWLANDYPVGKTFNHENFYPHKELINKREASNSFMSTAWCRDFEDAYYLIRYVLCNELGWLSPFNSDHVFCISPRGWLQLEGIGKTDSQIGFCAMWFSDEVKTLWTDCIELAIRDAGYEPLRIDGKQHNNKIDDEIIASIRQSKFVISDLTGNRGGVYYEAGFAHGLGLPVIFMCRQSDEDNPHFDIRQYNTIFWTSDNLAEKRIDLMNRIIATLGKGTYKPL